MQHLGQRSVDRCEIGLCALARAGNPDLVMITWARVPSCGDPVALAEARM
jgi:hypothetical protein